MRRSPKMQPGKRRLLGIIALILFAIMIGMIAWSYVVAESKIPR